MHRTLERPVKAAENPPVWPTHTGRNRPVPVRKGLESDWGFADGKRKIKIAGCGADISEDAEANSAHSSADFAIEQSCGATGGNEYREVAL